MNLQHYNKITIDTTTVPHMSDIDSSFDFDHNRTNPIIKNDIPDWVPLANKAMIGGGCAASHIFNEIEPLIAPLTTSHLLKSYEIKSLDRTMFELHTSLYKITSQLLNKTQSQIPVQMFINGINYDFNKIKDALRDQLNHVHNIRNCLVQYCNKKGLDYECEFVAIGQIAFKIETIINLLK